MGRFLISIIAFFILGCTSNVNLVVDKNIQDFGKVEPQKKLTAIFNIINNSNKEILIKKGETSCGCTIAELDHDSIPPNDKISIKVNTTTPNDRERFLHTATIYAEMPDGKIPINFQVTGFVDKKINVRPKSIYSKVYFNEIHNYKKDIFIELYDDNIQKKHISLTNLNTDIGTINNKTEINGNIIKFSYTVNSPIIQNITDVISMSIASGDSINLATMSVNIEIIDDIVVENDAVVPVLMKSSPYQKSIIVKNRMNKEFKIVELSASYPLAIQYSKIDPYSYTISLEGQTPDKTKPWYFDLDMKNHYDDNNYYQKSLKFLHIIKEK